MVIRFFGLFWAALSLSGCGAGATARPAAVSSDSASRNAAELFSHGEEAAKQGDTVRAEQYLSMALDRGFDEKRVLPIMLRVCLSSSRLRAALNHAEPYLRENPNDRRLRYLVATIHLGLGQLDDARIDLNHLLRLDPNDANAHYLLGVLESGAQVKQAPKYFRKYLKLAPQGEHAVEVRSRLTDLAVRVDLSQNLVPLPTEATLAPRAAPGGEPADLAKSPQSDDVAWFGSSARSTDSGPSKEGEP
jgi:tetratricopeptide (TPR) repeat protein